MLFEFVLVVGLFNKVGYQQLLRKLGSLQKYHELHLRITQGTCRSSIQLDIADIHTFHTIYERPPDHHFSGQSGDNHHFYFGLTPNEEFLTRSKTEKIIICINVKKRGVKKLLTNGDHVITFTLTNSYLTANLSIYPLLVPPTISLLS